MSRIAPDQRFVSQTYAERVAVLPASIRRLLAAAAHQALGLLKKRGMQVAQGIVAVVQAGAISAASLMSLMTCSLDPALPELMFQPPEGHEALCKEMMVWCCLAAAAAFLRED